MSELEYEKAGRGSRGPTNPIAAVSGEYAWGSTSIRQATTITNSGAASERGQPDGPTTWSNIVCCNNGNVPGPIRVGSFAKGVNNRTNSGGGFYGVMELSGNVVERAVTVGRSTGRAFQRGYHGNGILDSSGNPNVTSWPGTDAVGAGNRGGDRFNGSGFARLSDRAYAAYTESPRNGITGGRGVRSAP
jgi:hypothetical protein